MIAKRVSPGYYTIILTFLKDLLLSYGYDTNEAINELILKDISTEYANVEDVSGLINTFIRKVYDKEPHIEIRGGANEDYTSVTSQ